MEHTWRWFGPQDPVSLDAVRQAGATGIVTSLHHLPIGAAWSQSDISARVQAIEQANNLKTPLRWSVVESVPVHEDIKQGKPRRDELLEAYQTTLRHLGQAGVRTVCYNFMPVVDWTRTDLRLRLPNEAIALAFDWAALAMFDLFLLKRPGAERDYDSATLAAAEQRWAASTSDEQQTLVKVIIAGLPGGQEGYGMEGFRDRLAAYNDISEDDYRANLRYFLEAVVPAATEAGVRLAIHPDDPPFSLFGLPRILSTENDLAQMLNMVDEPANGFTLCTGSFGADPANDLAGMVQRHGSRLHFIHLRNIAFRGYRTFFESDHLAGHADMFDIVSAIAAEEQRRGVAGPGSGIPMRPDHGHQLLDDQHKQGNPGYTAIGRLKGLAELRGLEMAIWRSKPMPITG